MYDKSVCTTCKIYQKRQPKQTIINSNKWRHLLLFDVTTYVVFRVVVLVTRYCATRHSEKYRRAMEREAKFTTSVGA